MWTSSNTSEDNKFPIWAYFFVSELWETEYSHSYRSQKVNNNSAHQNGTLRWEGGKKAHFLAIRVEAHLMLVSTEIIIYSIACIHQPTPREILNHYQTWE